MEPIQTARHQLMKDMNTIAILQMIRDEGPISRADLSKKSGLNPATVSNLTQHLTETGLVRAVGIGKSSGGRKPVLFELDATGAFVIGVWIGPVSVQAAIVDLSGRIVAQDARVFMRREDVASADDVLQHTRLCVQSLLAREGVAKANLFGIGVGVHGLVDAERGISRFAPAFQWQNQNLVDWFTETWDLPVLIDNDVRVMALAEKWFGRAAQMSDFVFVHVGAGVGSGIYVNGQLLRGAHVGAGELGHIQIDKQGERCFCGKNGCISTRVSSQALVHRVERGIHDGVETRLSSVWQRMIEHQTGEQQQLYDLNQEVLSEIIEAATEGDAFAVQVMIESGQAVGEALALIVHLLDPELIVLGGPASFASERWLAEIERTVNERTMQPMQPFQLEMSLLGERAAVVGAATLVLQRIFQNPRQR